MLGKNMKLKHLFQSAIITARGVSNNVSCSGGESTETPSPPARDAAAHSRTIDRTYSERARPSMKSFPIRPSEVGSQAVSKVRY